MTGCYLKRKFLKAMVRYRGRYKIIYFTLNILYKRTFYVLARKIGQPEDLENSEISYASRIVYNAKLFFVHPQGQIFFTG